MLERVLASLASAARGLRAQPLFALTSMLTLMLGIGSVAAIFTVYDAVLLRPLPYAQADRIVEITREQPPVSGGPVSRPAFQEWHERSTEAFDAFAAYAPSTMNLTGAGEAERLSTFAVTPDFWRVFSNPLALGRGFGEPEEKGDERVAVLSDALWRTRFNAAADVVGRDVALNGTSYRVVGVAAPGFAYPAEAQVWTPAFLPGSTAERSTNYLSVVARLRDGVGMEAARDALAATTAWQARTYPDHHRGLRAHVESLRAHLNGRFDQPLAMLLGASALVLLIACTNLAGLMLARAQKRAGEFAVRRALGADRRRLALVVLAETGLIAAAGAALGLLVAGPVVRALISLAPGLLPAASAPAVDARVVGVIVLAAFAALLLGGLAPALRAAQADPADALRGGGRDAGGSRAQSRLRAALVTAQIALAFTLLAGSALLIDSLRRLSEVDTGVRSEQVLTAGLALPVPAQRPGEDLLSWMARIKLANGPRIDAILARVAELPGVRSAAFVDALPISGGGGGNGWFKLPGREIPDEQALVEFRFVSPRYFETLGIPLRSGRAFDSHDGVDEGFGTRVLVNRAFVDRFMGGGDALGAPIGVLDQTMKTIVGVVGNARQYGLEREAEPEVYFPARSFPGGELALVVKVDGDALAFAAPLRRALKDIAPDMPVFNVRTMDEATRRTTALRRFNLGLMSAFAAAAVVLAAIGLYGVIAYAVGQRRREIGLRQALGAGGGDIRRLILGTGLRMVVPGVALGLLGALALGRLIASQLYGVGAADPRVLGGVAALLGLVSLGACAVPTVRATRVTPMEALRNE